MQSITVGTNKGSSELSLHNIIRIQSMSNYSRIYFADNTYPLTVAKILQWFEDHLPEDMFLRTHRAHLVNRNYITRMTFPTKCIHLSNGEAISISKRRKQWVKERICA
ncbi:MAG: LytTR family DNA-binding domain-containing protein [Bacteroidetes bacterium]|nr:LytTR family DNA-binding domain-containing protein [Bacteroidota bacterium]